MTQYVIYQYDKNTGFINSTNNSDREENDPFLTLPGHLALKDYIHAVITTKYPDRPDDSYETVITGGFWFILDDNGLPTTDDDGNYLLKPPPYNISPPTISDYAVCAAIKSGVLIPGKNIPHRHITGLNRALESIGLETLDGEPASAVPVRTCVSKNVKK